MTLEGFDVLASGIGFTEGPLWTTAGELLVVSMNRGLVYWLDPELRSGPPVRQVETGGGPNGLAEGPGGMVYVAQNGAAVISTRSSRPAAPGVQRITGESVNDVVATGQVAPNDLVAGPDGRIWFTDPVPPGADKPAAGGGGMTPATGGVAGSRVCVYDPRDGTVATAIDDVRFPNGLAFGPDPAYLYVADTAANEIVRYRIGDRPPYRREVFARTPGAGPDGIAFDAAGYLYIAAFESDRVLVVDSSGRLARQLSTGEGSRPTNLCFAGPDLDRLVVTLARGGRVVVARERFPGTLASPWLVSAFRPPARAPHPATPARSPVGPRGRSGPPEV